MGVKKRGDPPYPYPCHQPELSDRGDTTLPGAREGAGCPQPEAPAPEVLVGKPTLIPANSLDLFLLLISMPVLGEVRGIPLWSSPCLEIETMGGPRATGILLRLCVVQMSSLWVQFDFFFIHTVLFLETFQENSCLLFGTCSGCQNWSGSGVVACWLYLTIVC